MGIIQRVQALLRRRFIRDTLILQSGSLFVLAVSAVSQAVLARVLGVDQFGAYRAVLVAVSGLMVLDISGAGQITRTYLAAAFGGDDRSAIENTLAWFLKTSVTVNGLLVIGGVILFTVAGDETALLARWYLLVRLIDTPYLLFAALLAARREMTQLVRLEGLRQVAFSIALIIGVFTLRIESLIAAQVVISAVFAGVGAVLYAGLGSVDSRLPNWSVLLRSAWRVPYRLYLGQGVMSAVDKNVSSFTVETLPQLMLSNVSKTDLGLFSIAYLVTTLPGRLISGLARNLETYLPFKAKSEGGFRSAFLMTTLASTFIWTFATFGIAIAGPVALTIFFGTSYLPAIGWIYPLLLQSVAVGMGVGLGAAFRTLGINHLSIIESVVITVVLYPVGLWLINTYGGYGAAWFVGLAWVLNALAGVAIVAWVTRKGAFSGENP